METQLIFGSRTIEFNLEYRNRKSLGIQVYPDKKVMVIVPLNAKEAEVMAGIKRRAPWILKQLDGFGARLPTTPPRRFVNGESHLYLGRQYKLKLVPAQQEAIKAYSGHLWIHCRNTNSSTLKKRLDSWYREQAIGIFTHLLQQKIPKLKKYGIQPPILIIRFMPGRWGSCTSSGKIILNPELIKAPKGCIEYVVTHELCHLVHHSHDKLFLHLLFRMMPDWEKWKKKLEYCMI